MAWAAETFPTPYVVPSGYRAVVRDIDVWSGGGAIIQFTVSVNAIARFYGGEFNVESVQQVMQWRGRQILQPGEELTFAATGALDGMISGYLLTLP